MMFLRRHGARGCIITLALCAANITVFLLLTKINSSVLTDNNVKFEQMDCRLRKLNTTTNASSNTGRSNSDFILNPESKNYNETAILRCPIIDYFQSVDKTSVEVFDPEVLCDDFSNTSDLVCRMYFRQIGLRHLERSGCALEENEGRVPKVVYFVIFGGHDFQFVNYVAIVGAKRHVNPKAIYVIGNQHPRGEWWEQVLRDVKEIRFVYRPLPTAISGHQLVYSSHLSDIFRVQLLYMNGGIYLDSDMVVLRDLDPILEHDLTMGMIDNATGMGTALITAKRGLTFFREWYDSYRTNYSSQSWGYNAMKIPHHIHLKKPERVHLESGRLYRPTWQEAHVLSEETPYSAWRHSYAVHIWLQHVTPPRSFDELKNSKTNMAEIFRQALYG